MHKKANVLEFYRQTVTAEFVESLLLSSGLITRECIFSSSLVIWLMIFQRLSADSTLESVLENLRENADEYYALGLMHGIRARKGKISPSTGGYSQARQRIPIEVVNKVADLLNESIMHTHAEQQREGLKVYVVDGTTIRIAYSSANIKKYPQSKNQHGKAHYPLIRMCVITDAVTGVALRPEVGAYCGKDAVSEHDLADKLMNNLTPGGVLLADRLYGCFRFVYQAINCGHEVICRLKEDNAKRFIGTPKTSAGEVTATWTPSARELAKYDNLNNAAVSGRFIWYTLRRKGCRPIRLVLFTTLSLPIEKIVELYGLRWNVETDLRDIKSTIQLDSINAYSPEMVVKEITLGVCAYNLVRNLIGTVAKQLKIQPRELSFTRSLRVVRVLSNALLSAEPRRVEILLNRSLLDIKRLMLPKRNKKRPSEPRKVWPTGKKNFMTGTRAKQRKLVNAN